MNKVFIVVLNWNQSKLAIECLQSLKKLRIKNYELSIVVVDNGSTDSSVDKIKRFMNMDLRFKIIENKTNLGFARGNNVGIKYALENGADYVMVLNNDTEVDLNLVVYLTEAMKDKSIGAVSPKIYFAKGFEFHKDRYSRKDLGKVIWYAGGKIDWNNVYGVNRGVDEVDCGQYDDLAETDFATGACMMLSARAVKKTRLFDEKYFMYLEDGDLSMRMRKGGWKVVYEPKGIVWHKVAQSSGIGSNLNDYFITRNRLLFGMKYAPLRAKIALVKESIKFLLSGRKWQKIGVRDFYLGRFGRGSYD